MSLRGRSRESVLIAAMLAAAVVPSTFAGDQDCLAWMERQPVPSPRTGHAMAYDSARGVTVLFGGYPSDTWEWDGETWTLRATSGPPGRGSLAMVYDSRRAVTVMVGDGETWEWDGETWTLRDEPGPSPRRDHAMAYDNVRGVTVLFGGREYYGDHLADTWEWDGVTWSLRSETGPSARGWHEMAFDEGRSETLLFGGYSPVGSSGEYHGDTWAWDGVRWSLRSETGPSARAGHAMAYDPIRDLTVLAGGADCWSDPFYCYETWEWDGTSWSMNSAPGPTNRSGHAMAFHADEGIFVLFGGQTRDGETQGGVGALGSDTWEWDGITWTKVRGGVPSPRVDHAVAYDSWRGVTVLIGGRLSRYPLMTGTWEWDGVDWALRNRAGPWCRHSHAMAFDFRRGVTVLFGGDRCMGEISGATWEWDGKDWQVVRESGPARYGHAMAYDGAREVVVMFGGIADEDEVGDTWKWIGWEWRRVSTTGPSARSGHAMAYDSARGVIVLFGGYSYDFDGSSYFADTWEWDGAHWEQLSNEGPSPRWGHAMVYDVAREETVLFGGEGEFPRETWAWDGTEWTQRRISAPHARSGHAMAYDSVRGVTVLFGGYGYDSYLADTWEYAPDGIADADFDGVADDCDVCPASPAGQGADETGCAPEDSDLDGDVDLRDLAGFQRCFFLREGSPECARFDPDRIPEFSWLFVDLDDFRNFLGAMTGPLGPD